MKRPNAMSMPVAQPSDYAAAESITRAHAKTFYFASRFLGKEKRNAAFAVYAVCRISDDAVDQPQLLDQHAMLARVAEGIARAYGTAELPPGVWRAFRATVRQYDIPQRYFDVLLSGMEMDLQQSRYATFAELHEYCYRVAGIIGLIMLKLFGQHSGEAPEHAMALGVAMQLTNILRDIREDAARGRIYLPQDEMRACGVTEADIFAGRVTAPFRELIKCQIARARRFFAQGETGIPMIADTRARLVTLAMRELYAAILNEIEALDYDVFAQRAYVSTPRKLWLLIKKLLARNPCPAQLRAPAAGGVRND